MKIIKSFQMFIGESESFDGENVINFGHLNENEIVPGVQLNPETLDLAKLKNNFYVNISDSQVSFTGIQKDSTENDLKKVRLVLEKTALSLPQKQGQFVAYLDIQPMSKTGNAAATQYLDPYLVKADGTTGELSESETATNLLGGFLFSSGIYLNANPSVFKNVLKAMVYLKREEEYIQAQNNGAFKSFFGGLMDALNKRDAFLNMKETALIQPLAKIGGEVFSKTMRDVLAEHNRGF